MWLQMSPQALEQCQVTGIRLTAGRANLAFALAQRLVAPSSLRATFPGLPSCLLVCLL